jgi:hypothetical protein
MASFARPPQLDFSKMPVKEIANKVYEYWNECGSDNIKFILYVLKHLKPILLTDGLPNILYKNFLRHFTFTYLKYDKRFITSLFQTALEENAITGVIRIVRNDTDKLHLIKVIQVKEPVFTDYILLDKLIELAKIVPQILMDSKINTNIDAVLSNSIIIFLNMDRPPIADASLKRKKSNNNINNNTLPIKRQAGSEGGTRKRYRKSKATRRLHRYKYCN